MARGGPHPSFGFERRALERGRAHPPLMKALDVLGGTDPGEEADWPAGPSI